MANKVTFADSLNMISEALKWAEGQDIRQLRNFFMDDSQKPLYCLASGGSYSAVDYAALLYEVNKGMAKALTPLSLSSVSDDALKASKILFTTSEGRGHDEKYVAKRAAKANPENTCAIVRNGGDDNDVVKKLRKAGSKWLVYEWLTLSKSFIATIDTVCKFGLFYRAFSGENEILDKLSVNLTPEHCFSYSPRVEGTIPKLKDIKNYIVLYNGWSRPVATDFESKMIESGIASVQLCDYRNWCHGRFIFLSKHMEDSALVLLLTPKEQQFVKDLFYGQTWRDKTDVFPANLPIIKVETEYDSSLATLDLLVKMYVLFDEIAKANGDDPCKPKNPCGIDKRFPKNTQFKGLL